MSRVICLSARRLSRAMLDAVAQAPSHRDMKGFPSQEQFYPIR